MAHPRAEAVAETKATQAVQQPRSVTPPTGSQARCGRSRAVATRAGDSVGGRWAFQPSSAARSSPHRAGLQPLPSPCWRRSSRPLRRALLAVAPRSFLPCVLRPLLPRSAAAWVGVCHQEGHLPKAVVKKLRPAAWHHAPGCYAPSSLHSAPPRTLVPFAPLHRATPPAFARAAPRPAPGRVFRFVPHLHTLPPAHRSAVELSERASATPSGKSTSRARACRLRSRRLKWSLFDARPLLHLTRVAAVSLRRQEAPIGFGQSQNRFGKPVRRGRRGQADRCSLVGRTQR